MLHHNTTPRQMEIGLAVIRVVVGIVFAAHGYQKFFVMGVGATGGFFGQLGIPFPAAAAILVSTVEFAGGIALALGVFTRLIAIPLAIDMTVALFLVHLPNGFFLPQGIEFVLVLLAASVTFATAGPGAFSVDKAMSRPSTTP